MPQWMQMFETFVGQSLDWKQVLLGVMTPVFVITFLIEWSAMRRRGQTEQFMGKDIIANLSLGASYSVFELFAHAFITGVGAMWFWEHRFFTVDLNPLSIFIAFIGVEFCYYWFHRTSHRVRWFWSAHVVHHSGEHMNMTNAMRQSMLYSITGWWLFFMPLVLLGIHPAVVFFLYAADLSFQYFVHTESVKKLPAWIEYVFVTPSHHRVHHGRNPQYIDKNYGGVTILFDRLFGTFEPEEEKVEYGIPLKRQPKSYNFLTLNFHEFSDMWKDVSRPGSLMQRVKHLWAPPDYVRPESISASIPQ